MKAIIIDDEPRAIDLLKGYLARFDSITLTGTFRNGLKALEFLAENKTDLIFLDINMPHLSGMTLSKMIPPDTQIIFTTAYSEYAVESYEIPAVDYLLKPISFERFAKAVAKVLQTIKSDEAIILVKSGAKIYRVNVDDIYFLEKDGNYMTYHLEKQAILARESVAEALAVLPGYFIQIHKSYIVNSHRIDFFDKQIVAVLQRQLPLGALYRERFLSLLQ